MTRLEKIEEILDNLPVVEVVRIHNLYCDKMGYYDDIVHYMKSFNEFMCEKQPLEIAELIFCGEFNPRFDYFYFDGYGNVHSFNFVNQCDRIDLDAIAKYVNEEDDFLETDKLKEIIQFDVGEDEDD